MNRKFTGKHMALILVGFFGVVVTVNLTMASFASTTFGGIVVENSYVASQQFNRWLNEAERERALGWQADVSRTDTGTVGVTLAGAPAGASVTAIARHPLGREASQALTFEALGAGRYVSHQILPPGRWTVRLTVGDGPHYWRSEGALR